MPRMHAWITALVATTAVLAGTGLGATAEACKKPLENIENVVTPAGPDLETIGAVIADGENLEHDARKNRIHRNDNSRVRNLNGDIRTELLEALR